MANHFIGTWDRTGVSTKAIADQLNSALRKQINQPVSLYSETNFSLFHTSDHWEATTSYEDPITGLFVFVHGSVYHIGGRYSPKELAELFLSKGIKGLENLNGTYTIIIWEAATKTLHLVNDKLGLSRLYLWQTSNRLVFSTQITTFFSLPGFKAELDPYGVTQFLITSHLCDDHTLIRQLRVLGPASSLSCTNRGISNLRYWAPEVKPLQNISLEECVEL
ncbi:MAG: hypothetical protein DRJ50_15725, partial [Actinobacteria bacterium]